MQTIYGLIADNGDGTNSMHWFKNYSLARDMLEQTLYGSNEGEFAERLTFPDDLDLESCGFGFREAEECDWFDSVAEIVDDWAD